MKISLRPVVHARLLLASLMAVTISAAPCAADAVPSGGIFMLGNSLTADAWPDRLEPLLAQGGQPDTVGYHIRTSSSLTQIWNDPNPSVTIPGTPLLNPAFGAYGEALPGYAWDAVTLQPHPRSQDTMNEDASAILSFIDLAQSTGLNDDTRFYIYAPWPEQDQWGVWDNPAPAPDMPAITALDYHVQLHALVSSQSDARIGLIPTGDVWRQVREDILADDAPNNLSSPSQIYRDLLHASNVGRYINALSVAYVTTGIDIRELPTTQDGSGAPLPGGVGEEVIDYLQDTVWTVLNDFYDARGDLDRNGIVELADRDIWATQFGPQPSLVGDLTGDSRVDQEDLGVWELLSRPFPEVLSADYDDSGSVDEGDLAVWLAEFGATGGQTSDGNGDQAVTSADYALWRDSVISAEEYAANALRADLNGDGVTDTLDQQIIESELGNALRTLGDLNKDLEISAADYTLWRGQRLGVPPVTAQAASSDVGGIPEPASSSVLLAAAAGLVLVRRRSTVICRS